MATKKKAASPAPKKAAAPRKRAARRPAAAKPAQEATPAQDLQKYHFFYNGNQAVAISRKDKKALKQAKRDKFRQVSLSFFHTVK